MASSCKEIEQMLVDYTDGRLSPGASSKVASHLAKCEDCRRIFAALKRSLELAGVIWEDQLAEIEAVRNQIHEKVRKFRWAGYAVIAAGILLVVAISSVWKVLVGPTEKEPTFAEIEQKIDESYSAARLLAAADLLAKYPDTEAIAKRQYHYVVKKYPQTPAAAEAKLRIK